MEVLITGIDGTEYYYWVETDDEDDSIEMALNKHKELERPAPVDNEDEGIYPMTYTPVILWNKDKAVVITTSSIEDDIDNSSGILNKNDAFNEHLVQLEDKWMEKNIVNSDIIGCGGVINEVHFRFEDEEDGYYLVCELEVEGIDSIPADVEEKILNKIEWAFDDIRDELAEQGLDLDLSLGEKLVLTRVDSGDLVGNLSGGAGMNDLSSNEELNELCDAISDKLMETGYLTSAIEEGDLATVSIHLEGDKNSFRININVQVDDRDSDKLSDDEEEAICDGLQFFIQEKQLESSFTDLGFDLDENCDGYSAYLVG